MSYNAVKYKDILMSIISKQKENLNNFVCNPSKDFSRTRKLPYEKFILSLLTMEGSSLSNELLRQFGCDCTTASSSAFVQQRKKLFVYAMENLFQTFISKTDEPKTFDGLRLLAVDGSDIQIPTNPKDLDSLIQESETTKPYNLLHLNALYDINSHTYVDAIINKIRTNSENKSLVDMVDRSKISGDVLVIADRGYEAYNNMAHIQEKGWKYLIRIKDFNTHPSGILHGLDLPGQEEFDVSIDLKLTRKQTNAVKELLKDKNNYRKIASDKRFDYLPQKSKKADETVMYRLPFRVVRFQITDKTYEVVVTNLDKENFPPDTLRKLYGMRWGIETSFRDLKYTIGLLHFHSKKVEFILQEIYARLIMYNFSELITSHVVIKRKDRKYEYKANFSVATHICREFLLSKNIPPDIENLIARYITPIRPGRSRPREMKIKQAISFMYRVA
jgi:hypothetical protein